MIRAPFRPDPLDDPLVAGWDAIVRNDREIPDGIDSGDMALMRRIQTLEEPASLSPAFFLELEDRLADVSPAPIAPRWWNTRAVIPTAPTVIPTEVEGPPRSSGARPQAFAPPSANRSVQPDPRSIHWLRHRHSLLVALAVLALLLAASLLVLYRSVSHTSEPRAIPAATTAEPTMETMVQLDFDPNRLGMPDATTWGYMEFDLFTLDPGKSFSTGTEWYTFNHGPLIITVVSGELAVQPSGAALFYPAGADDQAPVQIPPGQTVSLGPDDAIVFSTVEPAIGNNPGNEPVLALLGDIGKPRARGLGSDSSPLDITNLDRQNHYDIPPIPTANATVSIQRLRLAPFDSFVFDPDPELTYFCVFDQFQMDGVRMAAGALDGLSPDVDLDRLYSSTQLAFPDPGPHTIFNLGEKTVEIYFMVAEPAVAPATPTT